MGEPTSINAKVSVPGKSSGKLNRLLTFEIVCDWIRIQNLDEYTTKGLIDMAAKYPTHALPKFRDNFNLMIERVRHKRKQEQNAAENKADKENQ